MTGLTTHVLDTVQGRPAAGVKVELHAVADDGATRLVTATITNADGRTDAPLIAPEDMAPGTYEIVFHIGDYFAASGPELAERPFLDRVPVRFTIADVRAHYHVPLLASPSSYTTYRGS